MTPKEREKSYYGIFNSLEANFATLRMIQDDFDKRYGNQLLSDISIPLHSEYEMVCDLIDKIEEVIFMINPEAEEG